MAKGGAARAAPSGEDYGFLFVLGAAVLGAGITAAHFYDSVRQSQTSNPPSASRRTHAQSATAQKAATAAPGGSLRPWTVQPGQTLWGIAGVAYRQPGWWPAIWAANQSIIGNNPNLIRPGQQLALPPASAAQAAATAYARAYGQSHNDLAAVQAAQAVLAQAGY